MNKVTLKDALTIGKQTVKRLKVLHEQVGVSYGSVSLESIRLSSESKTNNGKLMLTNFQKVTVLKS